MEQAIASAKLLAVTRDSAVLQSILSAARSNRWQVDVAASVLDTLERSQSGLAADMLLVDMSQKDVSGAQILQWIRKARPNVPIILIDHMGDADRRQQARLLNTCNYLVTSFADSPLESAIQRGLHSLCDRPQGDLCSDNVEILGDGRFFIGLSPGMRKLRKHVGLLAETDWPVLVSGEPGSGKETVGRLIHRLSARSGYRFATVKCAALPEALLEKRIFGSGGSCGNGSLQPKRGELELCSKGTLFLDEIVEMPLRLQSLLAEALQEGRFVHPRTAETVQIDVRVVAATSVSVDQAISQHRLAAPLFHQLSPCEIRVPPLRERREELHLLSQHFMRQLVKRYGLSPRDLSAAAMDIWQTYTWPGNMRELEQSVKRYLVGGDMELWSEIRPPDDETESRQTGVHDLSNARDMRFLPYHRPAENAGNKSLRSLLKSIKEETEKNAIALALEKTGWNRKAAARSLKISYRTILYKIKQYHMNSTRQTDILAVGSRESRGDRHASVCAVGLAGVAGGSV